MCRFPFSFQIYNLNVYGTYIITMSTIYTDTHFCKWRDSNEYVAFNAKIQSTVIKVLQLHEYDIIMFLLYLKPKCSRVIGQFPFCKFDTRPLETRSHIIALLGVQ